MSSLGKIFIYEKNASNLHKYVENLRAQGFITFETDNIYKLLRYAEQVSPDVVIMNLSDDFKAGKNTWQQIHKSLCKEKCPEVYTNAAEHFRADPAFHAYDFQTSSVSESQILDILKQASQISSPKSPF